LRARGAAGAAAAAEAAAGCGGARGACDGALGVRRQRGGRHRQRAAAACAPGCRGAAEPSATCVAAHSVARCPVGAAWVTDRASNLPLCLMRCGARACGSRAAFAQTPRGAQEDDKRRAPGAVSDGGAPNGGDVCGKAALTARPAGGLVGVDCSVCMVRGCSKSPPAASAWWTPCLMPAPWHRPNAPAVHCQSRRLTPHATLADACSVATGAGAAGAGRAHPLRPCEHVPAVQPAPGALPHLSQGAPPCRRRPPALPAAPASARAAGRPAAPHAHDRTRRRVRGV